MIINKRLNHSAKQKIKVKQSNQPQEKSPNYNKSFSPQSNGPPSHQKKNFYIDLSHKPCMQAPTFAQKKKKKTTKSQTNEKTEFQVIPHSACAQCKSDEVLKKPFTNEYSITYPNDPPRRQKLKNRPRVNVRVQRNGGQERSQYYCGYI